MREEFGAIMALLLGTRHDHELMATRQQGPQLNRLLRHRTWFGTDGFGEVGDVGGVDRVALGEAAEGAGELRVWRGLTTATGRSASARAAATTAIATGGSSTISFGVSGRSRSSRRQALCVGAVKATHGRT